MDAETFGSFLWIMTLVAALVFIALYFVKAGYGMFRSAAWGLSVNNKLAWMLMEVPVFLVMIWMWWYSDRRFLPVQLTFFFFFQLHYFQRSFVFPCLLQGKGRMPVAILLMGILFNVLNGFMQGEWIFYLSPADRYTSQWFAAPQFILGTVLFFVGMGINCHSDYIIRHLRTPGDTRHYLPSGGLYRYVTSANYFGEIGSGQDGPYLHGLFREPCFYGGLLPILYLVPMLSGIVIAKSSVRRSVVGNVSFHLYIN